MTYTVKSNRSSYHLDGLPTRTRSSGQDTGRGTVAYFAESHCGSLTRGRFQDDFQTDDLAEALAKVELLARINNRNACRMCVYAAKAALAEAAERYTVRQIPGIPMWTVWDRETNRPVPAALLQPTGDLAIAELVTAELNNR
jgi:hypothetical protein